ncbi:MAG: AEC family transporter [Lachnospiraceae bacterium]|nr:AEC family transporter [Lachnospiraceae bacterium]
MENLLYSLNAVIPVFLIIVVGYVLKRTGMLNDEFAKTANSFVYKITLPAMLLNNMMACDIRHTFDGAYVLYCGAVTLTGILIVWGSSRIVLKDKSIVGEFVQGAYRGSAAILGIALVQNISGNTTMAPLMMLGSVPLYNIFAVIVLIFENGQQMESNHISTGHRKKKIISSVQGICKNPIIISILGGMLLSFFDVGFPVILDKTISSIGSLTTPLALIVIGVGFEGRKALKNIKPAVAASLIKLVIQPLVFLPVAIWYGFSADKIAAALVMLGAPTTATSYVMSKNMGHEGTLSSSIIMLTTLCSAFTITGWIFILKSFNVI